MSTTVDPTLRREGFPGLKGKNVLVTGGSSGIGQAIAVRFAEHGANVAINYLTTADEAAMTEEQVHACVHKVRQVGVQDVLVGGDVSDEADVVRMVGEAAEALGGIDVLVNNAGIQISRPSAELSSADFDRVLAVNLRGSFLCAREAIRHFLGEDKGGSIVNISSVVGRVAGRGYLAYGTAKAALAHYTRLAAQDLSPTIRVNAIAVGSVMTSALEFVASDEATMHEMTSKTPLGRVGEPEDISAAVLYLSSPAGGFLTGKVLEIDGGLQQPNLDLRLPDLVAGPEGSTSPTDDGDQT